MSARVTWFPGHMHKALKAMHKQLKAVDMVIEVRDARVPISAANSEFRKLLGAKRHHLVLNKADLIPPNARTDLIRKFEGKENCMLSCTNDKRSVQQVLDTCRSRLARESSSVSHLIMVLGLPNTGKSSLINAFRSLKDRPAKCSPLRLFSKGSRSQTGPTPGVTRQVSSFKISSSPTLYVMDTPGVMPPSILNYEMALRLGLTAAFKDKIIGERDLVRYLLGRLVVKQDSIAIAKLPNTKLGNVVRDFLHNIHTSDLVEERDRMVDDESNYLTLSWDMLDDFLCRLGLGNEPSVTQREAAFRKVLEVYRQGSLGLMVLDD